jgi:uncharacterized protein YciI
MHMESPPREYIVAIYTPGPNWRDGDAECERLSAAHREYQGTHFQSGKLVMGGPYLDEKFGLALFTGSLEDIRALVDADPCVAAGIYTVVLHRWRAAVSHLQ